MAVRDFVLAIDPVFEEESIQVDKAKYNVMRSTIVKILYFYGSLSCAQLSRLVENHLQEKLGGSVLWYFNIVKFDMEACGEIRHVLKLKQELIELSNV